MNVMQQHPVLPFAPGDWRIEPRGSVGSALAEARRRRAMSIEEVAAQTRVPVRYLCAIEDERFEVIPGRVYTMGFAKSFARSVGLCESWVAEALRATLADRLATT